MKNKKETKRAGRESLTKERPAQCVGEGSFFKERWMLGEKSTQPIKLAAIGESEKAWCKVVEIEG